MRQQIIIPWRSFDCSYRKKHFKHLYDFYSQHFDIIVADNIGEFNRSAARNSGVERSESEISVVIDADNYIDIMQIWDAIAVAKRKDKLVKPFKYFGYLTEESTELFYHGVRNIEDLSFMNPPATGFGGGAYVMKKSLWIDVGGMDEGFVGWGAEDDAFHIRCEEKLGKESFLYGIDYHLYHPAERIISHKNQLKFKKEYLKR